MVFILRKDLLAWFRSLRSVLVSVLVPAALLLFAALAGTVGQQFTVAVVDEQPQEVQDVAFDSPFLNGLALKRAEAERKVDEGSLAGLVDSSGNMAILRVTARGDEDLRRNLIMRQEGLVFDLNSHHLAESGESRLDLETTGVTRKSISDMTYLATGIIVFTALFGGMANTSYVSAREWEESTIKSLLVTPQPLLGVVFAKLVTGAVQTIVSVAVITLLSVLFLDVSPEGNLLTIAAVLLLTVVASCSLGLLLGVVMRRSVPAMMGSILVAISLWFVGGGFGPVSFYREDLQAIAWKVTSRYAIAAVERLVNMPGPSTVFDHDLEVVWLAASVSFLVFMILTIAVVRRSPVGGGVS